MVQYTPDPRIQTGVYIQKYPDSVKWCVFPTPEQQISIMKHVLPPGTPGSTRIIISPECGTPYLVLSLDAHKGVEFKWHLIELKTLRPTKLTKQYLAHFHFPASVLNTLKTTNLSLTRAFTPDCHLGMLRHIFSPYTTANGPIPLNSITQPTDIHQYSCYLVTKDHDNTLTFQVSRDLPRATWCDPRTTTKKTTSLDAEDPNHPIRVVGYCTPGHPRVTYVPKWVIEAIIAQYTPPPSPILQ